MPQQRVLRWTLTACLFFGILAMPSWGQYGTTYVTATEDMGNIVAAAVTDTNYYMGGIHTAYATARIVSPGGRSTQVTRFQQNSVTANAMLSIAQEDGTFTAYNWYPQEYCPVGLVYYALAQALDTKNMQKWIAIQDTTVSSTTIPKQDGKVDYTVRVLTSTNCSGNATVISSLSKNPANILALICKDGQAGGYPQSVTDTKPFGGGAQGNFDFDVKTEPQNTVTGTLTVSAGFDSIPAGCEWRTLQGATLVRQITVQQ